MSDILAIKQRAKSIKNIGKITKSLETVSALQLKSAEKKIAGTKEYFIALKSLARTLASHAKEVGIESVFLDSPKNGEKVLVLLISTDRGLVDGQNLAYFSALSSFLADNHIDSADYYIFGSKGNIFAKLNGNVLQEYPLLHRTDIAVEATSEIVNAFKSGLYTHVYLAYNEFIHMQEITPIIEQFLPLRLPTLKGFSNEIIERSFEEVLTQVTEMYLSYILKHALLEAEASEHAARTLAMKSASDNAHELSDTLTRQYNTARQEAVTEEILEGAFHHG